MEPIHLPTDALAEVFKLMFRPERAQLALVSSQAAEAILPGLNIEHRKVLATAPGIIADYQDQLDGLLAQCRAFTEEWEPVDDGCLLELARLEESRPPFLADRHLSPLGPEEELLMREFDKLQVRAAANRDREGLLLAAIDEIGDELEEAVDEGERLQTAILQLDVELIGDYLSNGCSGRHPFPATHSSQSTFQVEHSFLVAEQYETLVAIRRIESQLWERGVRILFPEEDAIRYQTALDADPQLAGLIADYTRTAARHREKGGMELEMLELYRQALAVDVRIGEVRAEYDRIKAEEGVPMEW